MFVGYVRVSKTDGSQLVDLQIDALIKADVPPERIYQDQASGRYDDRPGLRECLKNFKNHFSDKCLFWVSGYPTSWIPGYLISHLKTPLQINCRTSLPTSFSRQNPSLPPYLDPG